MQTAMILRVSRRPGLKMTTRSLECDGAILRPQQTIHHQPQPQCQQQLKDTQHLGQEYQPLLRPQLRLHQEFP
jgi:hypothetical protein